MKKLLMILICLTLFLPAALADFDTEALENTENCTVFQPFGSWDTVVRPNNQPFIGELEDGVLAVYLDYITLIDLEVTLPRLTVSVMIYESVQADTLIFTVDGKNYAIQVDCQQSEYDGTYMEDYTLCFTNASLPMLKAIAQQKKDEPIPVAFVYQGETLLEGFMLLPGDDAARIYDRFIDLGGKTQPLKELDDYWPCTVEKAK